MNLNKIEEQKKFLSESRKILKFTVEKLAKVVGCKFSTFRNYTCGSRPLPVNVKKRILNILEGKYLDNCGIEY